jgi:hypothetical protein
VSLGAYVFEPNFLGLFGESIPDSIAELRLAIDLETFFFILPYRPDEI